MPATNWQQELQQSVTSVTELLTELGIDPGDCCAACEPQSFPIKVPRSYMSRMKRGDPHDPLLRQVLPLSAERLKTPGFSSDAVGDLGAFAGNGVLRKYRNRALLITTASCAVHCRYCFRRDFPYRDHSLKASLDKAVAYISADPAIDEVILSGGDPLVLSNRLLFKVCEKIEAVPHVRSIRFHTRLPICIPSRLEPGINDWLNCRTKPYVIVFHINHPAEISEEVAAAVKPLKHPLLLNQSVLLKGINDDAGVLADLSRRCFDLSILPYYLHLLDKVQGTAHFEVDEKTALGLIRDLRAALPGYLVPRLAREVPGHTSKQVVA